MSNPDLSALEHFVRLARRGSYAGASGGERRAYELAAAVAETIHGLDGTAVQGLLAFVRTAREDGGDWAFEQIYWPPRPAPADPLVVDAPECCGVLMEPLVEPPVSSRGEPSWRCDACGREL